MAHGIVRRAALVLALAGCASSGPGPARSPSTTVTRDTTSASIPAGFGSLRQDDIAIRVQRLGLAIRAIPLDESIIRTLSPDSYRALHDLVLGRSEEIARVARRYGSTTPSVWYVAFYNTEQGEARFTPTSLTISNVGRDFRALDAIPLTSGFASQRLLQRETQSGLVIFDGTLDVNQPLTLQYESTADASWSQVLQRIERERASIRARAGSSSR